jgi:hypothetical protein
VGLMLFSFLDVSNRGHRDKPSTREIGCSWQARNTDIERMFFFHGWLLTLSWFGQTSNWYIMSFKERTNPTFQNTNMQDSPQNRMQQLLSYTLWRPWSYRGCQSHCSDCLNRMAKITVDMRLLKRCSLQAWKEMWVAHYKCCIWSKRKVQNVHSSNDFFPYTKRVS